MLHIQKQIQHTLDQSISPHLASQLKWNAKGYQLTSFKAGGDILCLASLKSADLISPLITAWLGVEKKLGLRLPIRTIGLGSNLLIKSKGFEGLLIRLHLDTPPLLDNSKQTLRFTSSVGCAPLARQIDAKGVKRFNFLAGIPGSLGGALAMNAGCHHQQIWDEVAQAQWLSFQDGKTYTFKKEDLKVSYRQVKLPFHQGDGKEGSQEGLWLSADFSLTNHPNQNYLDIKEVLQWRRDNQPIGSANCGSVFKNPPPLSAGALIEKAGLKGFIHPDFPNAQVSSKHANFIINLKPKTAQSGEDIEKLIEFIQLKVYQHSKIHLKTEVVVLG